MIGFFTLWLAFLVVLFFSIGQARRGAALFQSLSDYLQSEAGKSQLESVDVGGVVKGFQVVDENGKGHFLEQLVTSRSIILFVSDTCAPCGPLLAEVMGTGQVIEGVPVRVISADKETGLRHRGLNVFSDREGEAMKAFHNKVIPRAFLVDPDGLVLDRGVPNSVSQLAAMVRRTGRAIAPKELEARVRTSVS